MDFPRLVKQGKRHYLLIDPFFIIGIRRSIALSPLQSLPFQSLRKKMIYMFMICSMFICHISLFLIVTLQY